MALAVALRVGGLSKSFDVVGNRTWQRSGLLGAGLHTAASQPAPFVRMPISYSNAFGGVDRLLEDPLQHRWYLSNHVGLGYYENVSSKQIHGKPLPNTEEFGQVVQHPNGKCLPG